MDIQPGLKQAAIAVARALHRYADEKGWPADQTAVLITVNTLYDVLHVVLVNPIIDQTSESPLFDEVLDFLEAEFADVPEILEGIGLTLGESVGPFLNLGMRDASLDYMVDVDWSLLNPGIPDPMSRLVARAGAGH